MKRRSQQPRQLALGLAWIGWVAGPRLSAQTLGQLEIHTCAALAVTGSVGKVYSLEYATDLGNTNAPGAWRCLEYLRLPANPYLWIDSSGPASGQRFYRAVAMKAPSKMVFIPPGTFRMGSSTNEAERVYYEGPQTDVIISRGFWMGMYEVTQGEFQTIMGYNPSHFAGGSNLPVEQVGWSEAVDYCVALTKRERAAGRIATNCLYRLPKEVEWEYACRAWTSTRFSYGDDIGSANLTNYAWYSNNFGETTHPVGQKLSNAWGLHDMHGNV